MSISVEIYTSPAAYNVECLKESYLSWLEFLSIKKSMFELKLISVNTLICGLHFLRALYMNILCASSISSFSSLVLSVDGSWPRMTALSALCSYADLRVSMSKGDPLIKYIPGNLLILFHIPSGIVFIGVMITIYYFFLSRYLALSGNIKCWIEEWNPHTTMWSLRSSRSDSSETSIYVFFFASMS